MGYTLCFFICDLKDNKYIYISFSEDILVLLVFQYNKKLHMQAATNPLLPGNQIHLHSWLQVMASTQPDMLRTWLVSSQCQAVDSTLANLLGI